VLLRLGKLSHHGHPLHAEAMGSVPQVAAKISWTWLRFESLKNEQSPATGGASLLVAESGAYCDAPAALRPAAAQYGGSALGLHAGSKAVSLDALAAVGLECALGHGNALLNLCVEIYASRQVLSITQAGFQIQWRG
jgi:hypothetical protein